MDLDALIKEYLDEFASAPMYGGYSSTLRKKLPSKQQVKLAFIENIQNLSKVTVDPVIEAKIAAILKKFE